MDDQLCPRPSSRTPYLLDSGIGLSKISCAVEFGLWFGWWYNSGMAMEFCELQTALFIFGIWSQFIRIGQIYAASDILVALMLHDGGYDPNNSKQQNVGSSAGSQFEAVFGELEIVRWWSEIRCATCTFRQRTVSP